MTSTQTATTNGNHERPSFGACAHTWGNHEPGRVRRSPAVRRSGSTGRLTEQTETAHDHHD